MASMNGGSSGGIGGIRKGCVSRRRFIRSAGGGIGGLTLGGWLPCRGYAAQAAAEAAAGGGKRRLLFVAIDALHPAYLELNAQGTGFGCEGDWLMPNVRRFLAQSVWYPEAKDNLPAATDMNHLNALAGTNSGQTGIVSVSVQLLGWEADGKPVTTPISLAMTRDEDGTPVDTIFHAWKRARPRSTTAFISGKAWVAEMFRDEGVVDHIVTGENHPRYVPQPQFHSYCDPPTDTDAWCDPEALDQQLGLVSMAMHTSPEQFPADVWVVDAALAVFRREKPDLAYILLAQVDDSGHALGAGWDPSSRQTAESAIWKKWGCCDNPLYSVVAGANPRLFVEPMLDSIRDTDHEFGRLMAGLQAQGALTNTTVILLSDHGMITHLRGPEMTRHEELCAATDYYQLILDAGFGTRETVTPFGASSLSLVYWRFGKELVPQAKAVLEAHRAINPETGESECPWLVIDRAEMKAGKPGICLPGELYHRWFVETDAERTMVWPDLILLGRNGWEMPVYGTGLGNLGITLPNDLFIGPLYAFPGGHGSLDTQPIVMAIRDPRGVPKVSDREARISDLGVTAASLFGLQLQSKTVGRDLSGDLW